MICCCCVSPSATLPVSDPAKGDQLSALRPGNGSVVHSVALLGHLHMNLELNTFSRQTLAELVEKVVGAIDLRRTIVEMLDARRRNNAVASITRGSIAVNKAIRGNAEIDLFRKARRTGFGRLHELERRRVSSKKLLQRGRRWSRQAASACRP